MSGTAMLSRRSFLGAACASAASLALFGLTGCGGSGTSHAATAGSADPDTIFVANIGHLNSTAHLLAFIAKEEGFFDEENIDATLVECKSGKQLVAGLENGKLQVAFIGSVPTLSSIAAGHEISIFGGAMSNGHGYVINSSYTKGLETWDASILKGRTVAVPRTTIQELELYVVCEELGMTCGEDAANDVRVVYYESQQKAYEAFSKGKTDACSTYSPYMSIAKAEGHSVVFACGGEELFENQPCCRVVAPDADLAINPARYVAFERALIKAYAFYKDPDNEKKVVNDIKAYVDIPKRLIRQEVFSPGYCDSSPDPDKRATAKVKERALRVGCVSSDFDLDAHFNTELYAQALDSLMEEEPSNEYYTQLKGHFSTYE